MKDLGAALFGVRGFKTNVAVGEVCRSGHYVLLAKKGNVTRRFPVHYDLVQARDTAQVIKALRSSAGLILINAGLA